MKTCTKKVLLSNWIVNIRKQCCTTTVLDSFTAVFYSRSTVSIQTHTRTQLSGRNDTHTPERQERQTHTHTQLLLTWSAAVHQSAQHTAVPPVLTEVRDGEVRHFVLDPAEQSLLGRLFLGFIIIFIPDGHRDGVMEDEGPYQTQDQLQVPVHNRFAVCWGTLNKDWLIIIKPLNVWVWIKNKTCKLQIN